MDVNALRRAITACTDAAKGHRQGLRNFQDMSVLMDKAARTAERCFARSSEVEVLLQEATDDEELLAAVLQTNDAIQVPRQTPNKISSHGPSVIYPDASLGLPRGLQSLHPCRYPLSRSLGSVYLTVYGSTLLCRRGCSDGRRCFLSAWQTCRLEPRVPPSTPSTSLRSPLACHHLLPSHLTGILHPPSLAVSASSALHPIAHSKYTGPAEENGISEVPEEVLSAIGADDSFNAGTSPPMGRAGREDKELARRCKELQEQVSAAEATKAAALAEMAAAHAKEINHTKVSQPAGKQTIVHGCCEGGAPACQRS